MSTILALDIGTRFIKAVLGRSGKRERLDVLGAARVEQKDGSMHAGAVADISAVVSTCEKAIYEIEKESGVKARLVVVGISGELVKGNTTTVKYHRENPNKPISEEEIEQIVRKVQQKSGEAAREMVVLETGNANAEMRLINSAIVSLIIDGHKVNNPVGFKGGELEIQFYTAYAPLVQVAAIEKVCAELNLELLTLAVNPFAVCRACLGDDLEVGVSGIVIDVGEATTDIAIMEDGGVLGTKTLGIGRRVADQKVETWLTGLEVALDEFDSVSELPRKILLCGGGADSGALQEALATSDWFQGLAFSRRPVVDVLGAQELPGVDLGDRNLDNGFVSAIGLLRVGMDTLVAMPEENGLKAKIARLLQK